MDKIQGTLMLILTNQCNLRCVYCYEQNHKSMEMSFKIATENIRKVLNDNEKYSHIDIYLFGGEPFLCFDNLKKICEWTWKREWKVPYRFTISTNGTLVHGNIKEWLKTNKDKFFIVLSLDGKRKSQNINRSNSFDQIDYDFFREMWPDAGIKMTISEKTLPYLCEDVKYVHSLNFKFSECNLAMGIDWSDKENINILKEQLQMLYEFYIENPHIQPANIINMDVGGCENKKQIRKWCGVGNMISINTDGKQYPCNYINPMCFEEDDLEILLNIDYNNLGALVDKKCYDECYLYPLCPTCYGADYSLTKSVNKKDRSTCNLLKIRAYYTAKLMANKIEKIDIGSLSIEEKGKVHKTIKAIIKINDIYSNI